MHFSLLCRYQFRKMQWPTCETRNDCWLHCCWFKIPLSRNTGNWEKYQITKNYQMDQSVFMVIYMNFNCYWIAIWCVLINCPIQPIIYASSFNVIFPLAVELIFMHFHHQRNGSRFIKAKSKAYESLRCAQWRFLNKNNWLIWKFEEWSSNATEKKWLL